MKTLSELARELEILADGARELHRDKRREGGDCYWVGAASSYEYAAKKLREWIRDEAALNLLQEMEMGKS